MRNESVLGTRCRSRARSIQTYLHDSRVFSFQCSFFQWFTSNHFSNPSLTMHLSVLRQAITPTTEQRLTSPSSHYVSYKSSRGDRMNARRTTTGNKGRTEHGTEFSLAAAIGHSGVSSHILSTLASLHSFPASHRQQPLPTIN